MRKIKYRGKQIRTGGWVVGEPHITTTINPHIHVDRRITGEADRIDSIEIIPETIGQFTGLLDKNEKEIYEGDIIRFGAQYGSVSDVKYITKNAGYLVKDKFGDWQWLYDVVASTNCEIIGNIYDNPDLLK